MLLFEADALEIARLVFLTSKKTKRFIEGEIDDLIAVQKLYLSCDGNLLLARGKKPRYTGRNLPFSPTNVEEEYTKHSRKLKPEEIKEQNEIRAEMKMCQFVIEESAAEIVEPESTQHGLEWQTDVDGQIITDEIKEESEWIEEIDAQIEACEEDPESLVVLIHPDPDLFDDTATDGCQNGEFIEDECNEDYGWVEDDYLASSVAENTFDEIYDKKWAIQPFGWDDNDVVESDPEMEEVTEFFTVPLKFENIPGAMRTEDGKFKCGICNDDRPFEKMIFLWRHSEQHKQRSTLCSSCGMLFRTVSAMRTHELLRCDYTSSKRRYNEFHIEDIRKIECTECGKGKFRSELEYFDHMNIHSGLQPYVSSCKNSRSRHYATFYTHRRKCKCPLEGAEYPEYAERTIFRRWTLNGKQQRADELGEESRPKKYVKKGLRKSYPNGYICEFCNKKFTNSSMLSMHRATLHLERTLPCPECNRLFATQRLLKLHIKKHLFSNKCELCGKVYKCARWVHMKNYHSNFACDKCDFHANTKQALRSHVSRNHYTPRRTIPKQSEYTYHEGGGKDEDGLELAECGELDDLNGIAEDYFAVDSHYDE